MDVFGEVIQSIATYHKHGGYISNQIWDLVSEFAEVARRNWRRKDRGIWEVRGPVQHFVYSKIMCWLALEQVVLLAQETDREAPTAQWPRAANTIKATVEELSRGLHIRRYNISEISDELRGEEGAFTMLSC